MISHRCCIVRVFHALAISALAFCHAGVAKAQGHNVLSGAKLERTNCDRLDERPQILSSLTDGDRETGWHRMTVNTICDYVFRLPEDETIEAIEIADYYVTRNRIGNKPIASVTIWASHQDFGDSFFKIATVDFKSSSANRIKLDRPVRVRSLKFAVGTVTSGLAHLSLAELKAFRATNPDVTFVWPQTPPSPLKVNGDPVSDATTTECDRLAGFPFSPDSYGYSRLDHEIDVQSAKLACEKALSENPKSARLNFNMARVELLSERSERAVGLLTGAVLKNYPPAQYLLAEALTHGWGVEPNEELAGKLYRASASADFAPALYRLAEKAIKLRKQQIAKGEQPVNQEQVIPELQRAVDLGYLPAYASFFDHVRKYNQMPKFEAFDLLEQAAQYGFFASRSTYSIHRYNDGSHSEVLRYLERDARQNHANPMTNYSRMGSAYNRPYWRKRAALDGEGDVYHYYAIEFYTGSDAPEELRPYLRKKSFEGALAAAQNGDDGSAEWLSRYYDRGYGVEKDAEQARVWLCRARAMGNQLALSRRVDCTGVDAEVNP